MISCSSYLAFGNLIAAGFQGCGDVSVICGLSCNSFFEGVDVFMYMMVPAIISSTQNSPSSVMINRGLSDMGLS